MKTKRYLNILVLLSFFILVACSDKKKEHDTVGTKYTCPMHPQIVQDKPGTCPICGMDLVPMTDQGKDASIRLNESQQKLANIMTMKVGKGSMANSKVLNGKLLNNPEFTEVISSRVSGRLEQLYVKETGVAVRKGQPLYKIYSEQLLTMEQEYLLALKQLAAFPNEKRYSEMADAARKKLELYGQTSGQIERLGNTDKTDPYINFLAPASGIISELSAIEGQYVGEGSVLMKLENLEQLWVEAQLFANELGNVKEKSTVTVQVDGFESEPITSIVDFISPQFDANSQIITIRARLSNPKLQFQPGMRANIFLPYGNASNAITLPVKAVLHDGKGEHIWVKTGDNTFEPRMVKTGIENFDRVLIEQGVKDGDEVVISGAYLLYSEMKLKKGTDPMASHHHGTM
ncbi:efflux RND transporter periplasmic adaptor subunit [Solitalea koreensis]|uniref:Membrane fusion protein, Cu(I)/Ag(I) efflux system n=1 Tax=Solitalea koreensis TaxID=543615 RepID=A0A521DDD0_9SPHI|nr:efflux RND transporter periplasmic adaptor subunit [Solitalea koreensis]SMO68950.1 membrane fusion protein, Cu(I)/Ag(I) efflux system [Solitalea koreensis]